MPPTILHVVAEPNPKDPAAMQAYLRGVLPLLVGAGGEVLARTRTTKAVLGAPPGKLTLVMRFPDAASVEAVLDGPAYAALLGHREAGFTDFRIYLGEPVA